MNMFSRIVIEETIRRHVTHAGYITYVAFLAIVGVGGSQFGAPSAVWPTLVGLLAIITGCGAIGPEFSSGTLQLILVKPINRATYLLSRVAGVLCVIWLAAIVPFACEVVGRLAKGEVPWYAMSAKLLNTAVVAILTVSLLTLFGSLTRAYINVALYVALQIAMGILPPLLGFGGERYLPIARVVAVIDRNLFPSEIASIDRQWLLLVLSNAAVALVLACFAFRNREVPYGAD
ncbi:MAG: ABC transporter permease subunit [Acidobacteriota bacterium]|nr:ABC transporter permease subunit [Acidobacteriota bacterium]